MISAPWGVSVLRHLRLLLVAAISGATVAVAQPAPPGGDSTPAGLLADSDRPAGGFGETRDAALDCLAAAISYEAGREPVAGQEAVAQVVLNRVHHRAFPKTVCGVVYQGSGRHTGCQFTFTCDGSLLRRRSPASLITARAVAARVFDGLAGAGVGAATFYHADYVSPYWAPALARVGQIGAHIFYRFPGDPALATGLPDAGRPRAGHRAPGSAGPAPRQVIFSVWGLTTALVVPHGDTIEVRGGQ